MNFGASVSYRLNEQWSFGAGLDLIYGMGKLKRDIDFENCSNEGTIWNPDWQCNTEKFNALDVDASGFAVGGNIGVVYELNDNHRFGLSYRYSPTVTAKVMLILLVAAQINWICRCPTWLSSLAITA